MCGPFLSCNRTLDKVHKLRNKNIRTDLETIILVVTCTIENELKIKGNSITIAEADAIFKRDEISKRKAEFKIKTK